MLRRDDLARKQTRMTDYQTVTRSCRLRDGGLKAKASQLCSVGGATISYLCVGDEEKGATEAYEIPVIINSTRVHKYKEQSRSVTETLRVKSQKGLPGPAEKRIIYYINYLGFFNRKTCKHNSIYKDKHKGVYVLLKR